MNPDLVVRDGDGEIYTVRYEAVNAMILNEFLKEHRRVEEQRAYFELKLAQQQKQIEALTATVQKSERPSSTQQTCTRIIRQPLNNASRLAECCPLLLYSCDNSRMIRRARDNLRTDSLKLRGLFLQSFR